MQQSFHINADEFLPLRDVVFNTLRQAILTGELKPGDYRINVKVWAGNKEYVLSPHFLIR